MNRSVTLFLRNFSVLSIMLLTFASLGFGQPKVTVSPKSNPPTTNVLVSGTGFSAYAAIDIYFDTTDEALALPMLRARSLRFRFRFRPGLAGNHWVSGRAALTGTARRRLSGCSTNWAEFGFTPKGKRFNPYENVLSPTTVGPIDEQWSFTTGQRLRGISPHPRWPMG